VFPATGLIVEDPLISHVGIGRLWFAVKTMEITDLGNRDSFRHAFSKTCLTATHPDAAGILASRAVGLMPTPSRLLRDQEPLSESGRYSHARLPAYSGPKRSVRNWRRLTESSHSAYLCARGSLGPGSDLAAFGVRG